MTAVALPLQTYNPAQGEAAGLAAAMVAIDRLNSFVRTSAEYHYAGLMHHVYAMKSSALATANELGLLVRQPIFVRTKCRPCNGTGLFVLWRGHYRGNESYPCSKCGGTGEVRLDFSESRITPTLYAAASLREFWPLDAITWHTPRCGEVPEAVEETDWKPRSPGRPLTVVDVAECLNVAEERWPSPLYAASHYVLSLGRTAGNCGFCGADTRDADGNLRDSRATFVARGRLRWCADVCDGCQKHWTATSRRYGSFHSLINARMPLPATYAHPAVKAWVARHGGDKAVCKATPFADWGDSWA